jgi:hypothetical protein
MILIIKTVLQHVYVFLARFQSKKSDQFGEIQKLLPKKPKTCQIHANLWEAKKQPNCGQIVAKFMPICGNMIRSLVSIHLWSKSRSILLSCVVNGYGPNKMHYFSGCNTNCAPLQLHHTLCGGPRPSVTRYIIR